MLAAAGLRDDSCAGEIDFMKDMILAKKRLKISQSELSGGNNTSNSRTHSATTSKLN